MGKYLDCKFVVVSLTLIAYFVDLYMFSIIENGRHKKYLFFYCV